MRLENETRNGAQMHIRYRDRETGIVTVAYFKRHTMSRTMRRYPSRRYEIMGAYLAGCPLQPARGVLRPV